jgi:YrbI family 3-deoxy-D-manno-octulosonate 8-phosphate phosphatase
MKVDKKDVGLVIYDFDGVMTDNTAVVFQDGMEAVVVNRSDGLGVSRLKKMGVEQMILSTETNPVVQARAAKLGIVAVHACEDKGRKVREIAKEKSVSLDKIMYVGNDVNDLEAMKIVGLAIAPADACPEVLEVARYVTKAVGGRGVVREIAYSIFN